VQGFREKSGTHILVAAPKRAPSKRLRRRISEIICNIEDICEAHLPEVITIGPSSQSNRVLFLVFTRGSRIPAIMDSIGAELQTAGSRDEQFEVWPISRASELLDSIRKANCVIGWRD
jgi:hypothetical protein